MTGTTQDHPLPARAVLSQLPGLLGQTPRQVFNRHGTYKLASAIKIKTARGLLPNDIFDVASAARLKPLDIEREPILLSQLREEVSNVAEQRRRIRVLRSATFQNHGFAIRVLAGGQRSEPAVVYVEAARHVPVFNGMPPFLIVAHIRLADEYVTNDYLRAPTADDDLLHRTVEKLREPLQNISQTVNSAIEAGAARWARHFGASVESLSPEQLRLLQAEFASVTAGTTTLIVSEGKLSGLAGFVFDDIERKRVEAMKTIDWMQARERFVQRVGYDNYAAIFPVARAMRRRIQFFAGPTNSGKTHEALKIALEAKTAEVLSPLRLLALEHRDRLAAAGANAGLVTGEEVIGADRTHIARTIETLALERRCDVAVIDEIQMLGDSSRGWAWTQALIGVPADLVVLTGAAEAIPLVERIVGQLDETLEVTKFERKTPLHVIGEPVDLRSLQPGDALIAFSRNDVHAYREILVANGRSVAAVYGALGPEVRRAEADRFRTGVADILVATDAIGMGLNLPIKRLLFSATDKYDGVGVRSLTTGEILQIAGRAGRFGQFESGEVGVLSTSIMARRNIDRIRSALASGPGLLTGRAYVRPNVNSVRAAADWLRSQELRPIIEHLQGELVGKNADLRMADMTDDLVKAAVVDKIPLPLDVRYIYLIAPVNLFPHSLAVLSNWMRSHAAGHAVAPYLPENNRGLAILERDAQMMTLWLWLARCFPDVYRDVGRMKDILVRTNRAIETSLADTGRARADLITKRDGPMPPPRKAKRDRSSDGTTRGPSP